MKNEVKPYVDYEHVMKIDMRICEILTCEKVEKTEKLYKLSVKTGVDERTVITGIAQHFTPEDLIGKKFPFIMNMEPRKIRGIESHGMIIMAETEEGKILPIQAAEVGNVVL